MILDLIFNMTLDCHYLTALLRTNRRLYAPANVIRRLEIMYGGMFDVVFSRLMCGEIYVLLRSPESFIASGAGGVCPTVD